MPQPIEHVDADAAELPLDGAPPASATREVRGPYYSALRDAWRAASARFDASHPPLLLALRMYARDGRARGVAVSTLLSGLDALLHGPRSAERALDFGNAREVAGSVVIRAYYRDD